MCQAGSEETFRFAKAKNSTVCPRIITNRNAARSLRVATQLKSRAAMCHSPYPARLFIYIALIGSSLDLWPQ